MLPPRCAKGFEQPRAEMARRLFYGVAQNAALRLRRNISRHISEKGIRGRELNSRPADYESAALPLSYLGLVEKSTLAPAENCCQFYRKLCFRGLLLKTFLVRKRIHGPADPYAKQQKKQQRPRNILHALERAAPAQETKRNGYQEREQQHRLQTGQMESHRAQAFRPRAAS